MRAQPSLQQTSSQLKHTIISSLHWLWVLLVYYPPPVTGPVGAVVYIPSCCLLRTFFPCILFILFVPTMLHDLPASKVT